MINPNEKDVQIGAITLPAIGPDVFAVPGRGKISGRANAIRAAKNLVNSNKTLRMERNKSMRSC